MRITHIYPQTPSSPLQYKYLFNTQLESHIPIIPQPSPLALGGYKSYVDFYHRLYRYRLLVTPIASTDSTIPTDGVEGFGGRPDNFSDFLIF